VAGLIDTHAHLEDLPNLEAALTEAREAGVSDVIAMGVDGPSSQRAVAWAERYAGVWAAAGHHPLNADGPDLELLRRLAAHPRVVAVGEIGLDTVDEDRGPWEAQREWFAACCRLALETELPISVHVRGTAAEIHGALAAHPGIRGVMHYWSLDWEWARRFLDLGFYLSFSGLVTRGSREDLRQVVRRIPADRLLLETDTPWGTPRGRSGPMRLAWLADTAQVVAQLRGIAVEELAELERANVRSLFTRLEPG
jgi:TatD DNase family protein